MTMPGLIIKVKSHASSPSRTNTPARGIGPPASSRGMEDWREIDGYPLYEISDQGRARRRLKNGYHMLKPLSATNGYPQVCLYADGNGRRLLIHSLVAAAFLGVRPAGAEVNHKSGVKSDNRL